MNTSTFHTDDVRYMKMALDEASQAYADGDAKVWFFFQYNVNYLYICNIFVDS